MTTKKHRFQKVKYETIDGVYCQFANGKAIKDHVGLEAYLIFQLIKKAEIIFPLKTKPTERLLKIIFLLSTALDETYKLQHEFDDQVFNLELEEKCFPHLINYMQKKPKNGYIVLNEKFIKDLLNEYADQSTIIMQDELIELEK